MESHTQSSQGNPSDRDFVGKRVVYSTTEDFLERNRDNLRGRTSKQTPPTSPKPVK